MEKMLEVNKPEDCDSSNGGGRSQRRRAVNQQRVQAHRATRKRAGNISSAELAKYARARSFNIFSLFTLTIYIIKTYISVIRRIATCMMGMMGMFKWLRKDLVQRDRPRQTLSPKFDGLNNEAYRNAIQAFIERRKNPSDSREFILAPNSPDKVRLDLLSKNNYENEKNNNNNRGGMIMPGVPHVPASDIFEIGWVAGTEDRYLELIYAEWQHTRVSLRRHIHPDCKNAVRADLEVLSEIRHPNVILLMGTTQTEEHGLVAIFEPVDCTLFNYIHEQGERISVQGVAKCAGSLAAALRHAHMRGYIHSAISPHCVFLAATGIVKLGGWELATNLNGPKSFHDYEDRLRSEIFRWQAPELLSGHQASAATDIYSLTLLMWEMCTMNIPWNNLSKAEVERQYIHYRRGVVIDLYDFPSLLNNLLEAGLQLDVTKRTLDISKMSRYLQRLEMQYEDAEPIYIEQMTNNNKPDTPPVTKSPVVTKSTSAEPPRYPKRQSVAYQTSANDKQRQNDPTETPDILEEVLKSTTVKKANLITKNMRTDINKNRDFKIRRTSCPARADDSTDGETVSDPRVNIKKLKESLASKRETFFYGSDSSHCSPTDKRENLKSRMLIQVRSKDYEPHKPASHKTSLEPKLNNNTSSQYGTYTKSTTLKTHKPYSYVPTPIRGAIIQPQVLNPDSTSFFETSLWRKEKEICISKMRRSHPGDYRSMYTINGENKRSPESNETYTINGNNTSGNKTTYTITDSSQDMTVNAIPRSKSLQALKDSLDRATNIVKSTTPNTSSSTPVPVSPGSNGSSPFTSPKSFADDADDSRGNESVFEELYKLNEMADDEIKSIERSGSGDTFVVDDKKTSRGVGKSKKDDEKDKNEAKNCITPRRTPGEFSRIFHCASITEKSNEHDQSGLEKNREPEALLHESASGEKLGGCDSFHVSGAADRCNGDEKNETSFTLLVFGDKSREKGCFSCAQGSLARRRSLPAHLGQLRSLSNTPLGKIPIRRIDLPDNTVEDIYIDDEFGDGLAVNMILLNEEDPADDNDDFLPDLLELSDGSHECDGYP